MANASAHSGLSYGSARVPLNVDPCVVLYVSDDMGGPRSGT